MTTIIVHGTWAPSSIWWRLEGGFSQSVIRGMEDEIGIHDVWSVDNIHVSQISELNRKFGVTDFLFRRSAWQNIDGQFHWLGSNSNAERRKAARELVSYLNVIRQLTDEPINIIAHSHGCNVVKLASASDKLSADLFIEKAVFLACPHFNEAKIDAQGNTTYQFQYRLDPHRFGSILNLFSEQDSIQNDYAPRGADIDWDVNFTDLSGNPESSRVDKDPDAFHLYQNYCVEVDENANAHSALHGRVVGEAVGLWLGGKKMFVILVSDQYGGFLPTVQVGDEGES